MCIQVRRDALDGSNRHSTFEMFNPTFVFPQLRPHIAKRLQRVGQAGVSGLQSALLNRECPLEQRLGIRELALKTIAIREIAQSNSDVWMFRIQHLGQHFDGTRVEVLGRRMVSRQFMCAGKIAERRCDIGMTWSKLSFPDR